MFLGLRPARFVFAGRSGPSEYGRTPVRTAANRRAGPPIRRVPTREGERRTGRIRVASPDGMAAPKRARRQAPRPRRTGSCRSNPRWDCRETRRASAASIWSRLNAPLRRGKATKFQLACPIRSHATHEVFEFRDSPWSAFEFRNPARFRFFAIRRARPSGRANAAAGIVRDPMARHCRAKRSSDGATRRRAFATNSVSSRRCRPRSEPRGMARSAGNSSGCIFSEEKRI